jgi:hypothetical protein
MQFDEYVTPSAAWPVLPTVAMANPPVLVLLWQASQETAPVGTWPAASFIAPLVPAPWQL